MTCTAFILGLLVGALIVGPVVLVLAYVAGHRNEQRPVKMTSQTRSRPPEIARERVSQNVTEKFTF